MYFSKRIMAGGGVYAELKSMVIVYHPPTLIFFVLLFETFSRLFEYLKLAKSHYL